MIEPGLRRLTVSVPDEQIADLRERLARTRWPDQLDGISWEYGASLPYIKELAQYWLEKYDWKKAEAGLNSFANYEMLCNGIETHFIHERSIDPHAIPLLMVHGWPGSFFEFHKIIRMLTMPGTNGTRAQAFHVVVPSLPGYGFSSAPTQPGFGINEMAKTFDQLMVSLGYTTYVAQGGDWGSAVVTALGGAHSNHCRAIYMNGCFAGPEFTNPLHVAQLLNAKLPLANWFPVFISFQEMAGLRATQAFIDKETGYSKLQATKPQTIGFALNDSPVGLLAYIVEKFRTWSDCHGDVESRFTKDELLTNVSIYWYNAAITSSMRLYYETMGPFAKPNNRFDGYVRVPVAVGNFPKELYQVPRAWAASKYNLKQWSIFNSGGHFAALEEPDALAEDMRKFFAKYH